MSEQIPDDQWTGIKNLLASGMHREVAVILWGKELFEPRN